MSDISLAAIPAAYAVECILQRPGGSDIELRGADGALSVVHFAPQSNGAHVAAVSDQAHFKTLMAIPEAYRLIGTIAAPVVAQAHMPPAPAVAPEPSAHEPEQAAPSALLPSVGPDTAADVQAADVQAAEVDLDAIEDINDMRAQYLAEVGKAAPPALKMEGMRLRILEARINNA